VVLGLWTLDVGNLISSGFVPAAGMRVRVKIGCWQLFLFGFVPVAGMNVSMNNYFGCWLLAIGGWNFSLLFMPPATAAEWRLK
jgi:hypothetical protein